MATFTGACLCGNITCTASGDPAFMGVCHCKDCQRATGSAFEAVVAMPEGSVNVAGTPKVVTVKGDSGKGVHRSFCPDCGSTLMSRVDVMPGITMLTTGPMNDTSAFKPTMQIFCDSAQPWVALGGISQSFPKMPG